jgi:hypothetical protein
MTARKKNPPPAHLPAKSVNIDLDAAITKEIDSLIPASCREKERQLRDRPQGTHAVKYRPIIVKAILANIARGMPQGAAAATAGVNAATLIAWKNRYGDFAEAVTRAEALCQADLVTVVRGGFAKNPRLALEMLERRFPRDWAAASKMDHSGAVVTGAISVDLIAKLQTARAQRDGLLPAPTDDESVGFLQIPEETEGSEEVCNGNANTDTPAGGEDDDAAIQPYSYIEGGGEPPAGGVVENETPPL